MSYVISGDGQLWSGKDVIDACSTMTLLLSDYYTNLLLSNGSLRAKTTKHALSVIGAKLRLPPSSSVPRSDRKVDGHFLDLSCDTMLLPLVPALSPDQALEKAFLASAFMRPLDPLQTMDILLRWFSRTKGIAFVRLAIQMTISNLKAVGKEPWIGCIDVLRQLNLFKVSPNPEQDARILVLEIVKLVTSIAQSSYLSHIWVQTGISLPLCHRETDCDGLCLFGIPIIQLLEKARSLPVDLPFADVETLDVTWEELSLTLSPEKEDVVLQTAAGRQGQDAATIEHRNAVKAYILEAFRPFFKEASQPE